MPLIAEIEIRPPLRQVHCDLSESFALRSALQVKILPLLWLPADDASWRMSPDAGHRGLPTGGYAEALRASFCLEFLCFCKEGVGGEREISKLHAP